MNTSELHPRDLLFRSKVGPDGKTLFKSQADLARAVRDIPGSEFSTRPEESIRNYISQVLKPASNEHSRPLSDNLRYAILEAVKLRLPKEHNFEEFERKLDGSFNALKEDTGLPKKRQREFEELQQEAEKATHQVIFTPHPAEVIERSKYADDLKEQLVDALHLVSGEEEKHSDSTSVVRYEFFVHKVATAKLLWQRLYIYLFETKGMDPSEACKILGKANSGVNPRISVYVVDAMYCVFPSVVLDPGSPNPRGFNLYYHTSEKNDEVSVAKMTPEAITLWNDNIYTPNLPITAAKGHAAAEIRWSEIESSEPFKRMLETNHV